ncbi:MAG: hypothetical protein KTR32_07190 [Granulosicoccus sp.]|nr:hypothetical protein [Granulosicoccus sp.]
MISELKLLLLICLTALTALFAYAEDSSHSSAYAGQEKRTIKSLSEDDIAELRAGSGWGLAKAAELNGLPGPLHLLEMKDQIDLSNEQVKSIEKLFDEMNVAARDLGAKLIEKEQLLELRFQNDIPDEAELESLLTDIGQTRSSLRFVHLSAHLKTPDILSTHQITKYNQLRGYTSDDPCSNVPEGHDATMWKKHNGCE